jgi:hypothetical protein
MKIKNRQGMEAVLTAAVTTDEARTIVFASIVGAQTAVKALWASILNRRTALHISGRRDYCFGDGDVEYVTIKQSPAPGVHHWVMYPEPGPEALFLLLVPLQGMSEEEQLVRLLNQHTLWPVKDEWASELWERGVAVDDTGARLIRELTVHGDLEWAYAVATIGWDDVIDRAAKDGRLAFTTDANA